MTKAGLLESQRGPSDGGRLAQAPEAISLMDIVQAINGEALFTECILGLPGCGEQQPGPIHDTRAAERARIATTLAYAAAYMVHARRPAGLRYPPMAASIRGFTVRFRGASFLCLVDSPVLYSVVFTPAPRATATPALPPHRVQHVVRCPHVQHPVLTEGWRGEDGGPRPKRPSLVPGGGKGVEREVDGADVHRTIGSHRRRVLDACDGFKPPPLGAVRADSVHIAVVRSDIHRAVRAEGRRRGDYVARAERPLLRTRRVDRVDGAIP